MISQNRSMIHSRPCKHIRRRSAFAELRDLPRVGQVRVENPDWFEMDAPDLHERFEVAPLPPDHPAARHFGLAHNDTRVLDLRRCGNDLHFAFQHHDVWQLACCLDDHNDRLYEGQFKVTFQFKDVLELAVLRFVEEGTAQKIRSTINGVRGALFDVRRFDALSASRYLLDVHGFFRPFKRARFKRGGFYSYDDKFNICIKAERLEVVEQYREYWARVFRGGHLDLLDAFEPVWPNPGWGVDDYEHWIAEHRRP